VSPRWIPRRSDGAGLALVVVLTAAAMWLTRVLPRSPLISDVLLAMLLGAIVVNTPLGRPLGLKMAGGCPASGQDDRYASGVAFSCSWLLRLAIVLMGLKVQTSAIGGGDLLLVVAACAITVPSTFLVAQVLGTRLGLRGPFTDLLAAGSMICGASAVNATAPIVGAEKQEQGLAVGIVFLSSVAAMLSFRAIAHAVGLPAGDAGLWAGLSVNDLSSAVAVGAQMGGDGGVTAAAAKSTRILMLAPMLVTLAMLRGGALNVASGEPGAGPRVGPRVRPPRFHGALRKSIMASLPRFILGYLALAVLRVAGDRAFGADPRWLALLDGNRLVVELLMAMVSAGIGLNLVFGALRASGSRGIAASVGASAFMAAITLGMVIAYSKHGLSLALALGCGGLLATTLIYHRWGRRAPGTPPLGELPAAVSPSPLDAAAEAADPADPR
jgi:uncharacterized integral membrane protein (TIGR00698 family)